MAILIKTSINIDKIPSAKLIDGKKGRYANLLVRISDEPNEYGKNVSVTVDKNKTERENNEPTIYVGEGKVVWQSGSDTPKTESDDLPF